MAIERIPIQNIYFLLCYAWGHLQETEYAHLNAADCPSIWDLLAKMMIRASQRLVKRGLHRDYVLRQEHLTRLRGKLLVSENIRRPNFTSPSRICEFDELDENILPNRIIASTFAILRKHPNLERCHQRGIAESLALFENCARPRLTRSDFRRVRLNRNMRHYRFILNLCELIHSQTIATDETGRIRFRDFNRNEATMGLLFEAFIRNFYDKEQTTHRVSSPRIQWNFDPHHSSAGGLKLLPVMNTDICMESPDDKLIIDCKFYREMFIHRHDSEKLIPAHLYQLFAYLRNQAVKPGWESVRGMLLYPAMEKSIDEFIHLHGHEIRIATIDLAQDWQSISGDLLQLILPR